MWGLGKLGKVVLLRKDEKINSKLFTYRVQKNDRLFSFKKLVFLIKNYVYLLHDTIIGTAYGKCIYSFQTMGIWELCTSRYITVFRNNPYFLFFLLSSNKSMAPATNNLLLTISDTWLLVTEINFVICNINK